MGFNCLFPPPPISTVNREVSGYFFSFQLDMCACVRVCACLHVHARVYVCVYIVCLRGHVLLHVPMERRTPRPSGLVISVFQCKSPVGDKDILNPFNLSHMHPRIGFAQLLGAGLIQIQALL